LFVSVKQPNPPPSKLSTGKVQKSAKMCIAILAGALL